MGKKKQADNRTASSPKNIVFQKRRMQIVKKAAKLFMKKGYAQTSMRQISRATGIDLSNLYYFIESKEEILFLVFEMIHSPENNIFDRKDILSIKDPVEQLMAVIREMINFSFIHKDEVLLLYRESKLLPKKLLKEILVRENHFVCRIEDILKRGLEKKVFRVTDPGFTASMILFELSIYPLRSWNLKNHSTADIIHLAEQHIMKAVMTPELST